ncbi:helix-turn-helix domain-containing protein [Mesorhizobium tamadayense]|uniref:Helix-turn-helix domain-containing protein n=1 Tax=Mesorhizobium tamadayense TaxID=425306 RepID=A0A3P3FTS0_9HYPH|nr:helix-turn-helix domain-containing protein [Mesorhizobium tamadayense]
MDRQTLRDWVHRFNEDGPDGLKDTWYGDPRRACRRNRRPNWRKFRAGTGLAIDGVVRWWRIDLQRVIEDRPASPMTSATWASC